MTKKEIKWTEVEDPSFFQFKEIGDKLEGKLIEKGISENYKFGLYTVVDNLGETHRFHGTNQLDTLMNQIEIGDVIKVEFTDTQNLPLGEMKLFKVLRQK